MDWNRVEGNWKQFKGNVKEKWGKLTDDDLNVINGRRDQLEGKIQQRYGYAKDQVRKDVDDWINRLWAAGHMVMATSGSSGKCSFLNHTRGDSAMKKRHFRHAVCWPFAKPAGDRPVFWLGPSKGPNSACEAATINAENWGRPGLTFSLTEEPLRIAEVSEWKGLEVTGAVDGRRRLRNPLGGGGVRIAHLECAREGGSRRLVRQ